MPKDLCDMTDEELDHAFETAQTICSFEHDNPQHVDAFFKKNFKFLSERDNWLKNKPKSRLSLLNNENGEMFLPLGKTGMLVAPGGTGKTQILIQLAMAIASGKPWLDKYPVIEPGHVLLALGEEDEDEIHRRLYWSAKALNLDEHDEQKVLKNILPFPLYGKDARLEGQEGVSSVFFTTLEKYLLAANVKWKCLILDPASRFMGKFAETDNAAATRFVEKIESLTKINGHPTVLMAHHTSKGYLKSSNTDQGAARGSSALTDGVRWQCNLKTEILVEDIKVLRLVVVKNNYAPSHDDIFLKFNENGILRALTEEDNRIISEKVAVLNAERLANMSHYNEEDSNGNGNGNGSDDYFEKL